MDIQADIAFPIKQVRRQVKYGWKKPRHVLTYLSVTIDLMPKLQPDSPKSVKWWLDASFMVHPNMWIHKGGA